MNILLDLFLTFAKIGLFTFGGGYAMISVIEDNCVEKKKWITHDDMMNITVIAESTPGPVAINCATFVGYKQKGVIGAIVATLGVVLPSFVIIFLIAKVLDNFLENKWIAAAFRGIKLAVGVLILDVALRMIKQLGKKPLPIILMTVSALAMMTINVLALQFSSIIIMLMCGAVGLIAYLIYGRKKDKVMDADCSYDITHGVESSVSATDAGEAGERK
ncbi:MAG: chromate transporter [Lachnospiraceae bacterium]|nr:chromate transporter [Lachnospiraceae bacterium]